MHYKVWVEDADSRLSAQGKPCLARGAGRGLLKGPASQELYRGIICSWLLRVSMYWVIRTRLLKPVVPPYRGGVFNWGGAAPRHWVGKSVSVGRTGVQGLGQ